MPKVRGSFVLSSVQFVRARHGPEAHERVLRALAPQDRVALEGRLTQIRDSSWEPLALALAYMEAAKRVLAPADAAFFVEMGRFAAEAARRSGFGAMLRDLETAVQMLPVLGRAFIDVGRIEVTSWAPQELSARLYDFPPLRALCERRIGAWEAMLTQPGASARVTEAACVTQGHPWCELHVVLGPS